MIWELRTNLTNQIVKINEQIEIYEKKAINTIQYHEKDFLLAYSGHMGKV
jgi:hypothetical protein